MGVYKNQGPKYKPQIEGLYLHPYLYLIYIYIPFKGALQVPLKRHLPTKRTPSFYAERLSVDLLGGHEYESLTTWRSREVLTRL